MSRFAVSCVLMLLALLFVSSRAQDVDTDCEDDPLPTPSPQPTGAAVGGLCGPSSSGSSCAGDIGGAWADGGTTCTNRFNHVAGTDWNCYNKVQLGERCGQAGIWGLCENFNNGSRVHCAPSGVCELMTVALKGDDCAAATGLPCDTGLQCDFFPNVSNGIFRCTNFTAQQGEACPVVSLSPVADQGCARGQDLECRRVSNPNCTGPESGCRLPSGRCFKISQEGGPCVTDGENDQFIACAGQSAFFVPSALADNPLKCENGVCVKTTAR